MSEQLQILSLGAGVQSSALLMMSATGELPKLDAAIFADTGWEPQAVYDYAGWLTAQAGIRGIPVLTVYAGHLRRDSIQAMELGTRVASMPLFTLRIETETEATYRKRLTANPKAIRGRKGDRGIMGRQCTKEYKIEPVEAKCRELLGLTKGQRAKPGSVKLWKGISLDEIQRCGVSSKKWVEWSYPLVFDLEMNRTQCARWFSDRGFPVPPKSSCIGCPYHSTPYWRDMAERDPAAWRDAIEFDTAIRDYRSGEGLQCFLHSDRVPLSQVDLSTREERGEIGIWSAFTDECAGVCGV